MAALATGADFFGFVFGTVAGVIAYVVAVVATINRFRPKDSRAGHVAANLAVLPLAFPIVVWVPVRVVAFVDSDDPVQHVASARSERPGGPHAALGAFMDVRRAADASVLGTMNHTAPLPPPPADARPVDATPRANGPQRLQRPIALFLATAAIAGAAAAAVGTLVGFAAAASSQSNCSPSDSWCDLGAALVGVAFGGLAGVIAYVVAGVVIIRRFRPQGDRAKLVAAHLAFPPAVIAALSALSAIVEAISLAV